jgi:hypothetical protein
LAALARVPSQPRDASDDLAGSAPVELIEAAKAVGDGAMIQQSVLDAVDSARFPGDQAWVNSRRGKAHGLE